MASPKKIIFQVYNASTGAPLSGATPTFSVYKTDLNVTVTQPAIAEIGTTAHYAFTPAFADLDRGIIYTVATGGLPAYVGGYLRPEDWNSDNADVASSTLATAASLATVSTNVSTVNTNVSTVNTNVASLVADVADVADDVASLLQLENADEELVTTGDDAGRLVYRDGTDHTTELAKYDCLKADGTTKDITGVLTYYRKKVS